MSLPHFKSALPIYHRSAFILLAPVADWLEDGGLRPLEHQSRCCGVFRQTLVELGIPFLEVGGDISSHNVNGVDKTLRCEVLESVR